MIVQQLNAIQERHGYLPREALVSLADRLAVPLYRIQEVVSFYPHYRRQPPPAVEVHVCRDMSCCLRGSAKLTGTLEQSLAKEISGGRAAVCPVSCLGRCDRAPAARLDHNAASHQIHNYFGRAPDDIVRAVQDLLAGETEPSIAADRDADLPDRSSDWKINVYAGQPREERYRALAQVAAALRRGAAAGDAERDRIIQAALKNAVLLGMGGAGGQAFKKWCEVREAVGERKYVVCNADESEPGTFKDRELLLRTPYLVVEGVLLAGLVLGAEQGYIYIRHEYEECIAAVREEIAWARQAGLCGDDILGCGAAMHVDVFVSPGGYICGEQTALIQAIEDKRAEPRNRPPELQTNGLWDLPTLVNNVETLAWAPAVILLGEAEAAAAPGARARQTCRAMEKAGPETDRSWYGRQGRPFGELAQAILGSDADWQRRHGSAARFPGRRMFALSGDVHSPGVYEVENGTTVRELLALAGGIRGARPLLAIALSGPSGGFTPAVLPRAAWPRKIQKLLPESIQQVELLDLQMHINYFRVWDLMLGAGIVVYAAGADLVAQALACQRFFQAESCGKCVPCRIGSTKLAELTEQLAAGRLSAEQIIQLQGETGPIPELALTMASTAICGLGTVAPNPLTSLLRHFPKLVAQASSLVAH
ncbi:MAG TPA: NAD(P)H-dependent oxidoreductase subunit E [Pirellulaceae bacterium]|nr:NAD(P)H-dependent oxidoreductase subunit E [Pirellulaceae bacterium]